MILLNLIYQRFYKMKHLKLALILILFSVQSVWAEFKLVGEVDSRTYFVDYDSIKKDGNFRMVWTITNLPMPGRNGELSWKNRNEYDCYEERWRSQSSYEHSEAMGRGTVIRTIIQTKPGSWWRVRPDPNNNAKRMILNLVCAK
jgi:hypothetical protein